MSQLIEICKKKDRRCPSAPKIRGESREVIDKLRPITVVTAPNTPSQLQLPLLSYAQLTGQCRWVS
jgi:hypothetical protein